MCFGQYSALPDNHIRLVHLLPADDADEVIECQITVHREEECPRYEALSYTWGASDDGFHLILISDQFPPIRSNLGPFLEQLRTYSSERIIWADAICIDQDNVQERNHQVEIMGLIYRNAFKTLVWLGPESQDSDRAMDWMAHLNDAGEFQLAEDILPWILSPEFSPRSDDDQEQERDKDLLLQLYIVSPEWITNGMQNVRMGEKSRERYLDLWKALSGLTKRPYWRRTWIIQKIILSSKIELYYGQKIAPWNGLRMFLTAPEQSMDVDARATVASMTMALSQEDGSGERLYLSDWKMKKSRRNQGV